MTRTAVFAFLSLLFGLLSGADDAAAPAPGLDVKAAMRHLEQHEAELEKWAGIKAVKGSAAFAKKEAGMQEVADRIIDYDFIARFVLGDRWESTPQDKRDQFFQKLRQLFREFYLEEVFYNKSYEKRYIDKGLRKNYLKGISESVFVTTEIQATLKKKPVIYEVVYHLYLPAPDGSYRIFDIELDGVSMLRNYREQFSKTLKESGIDELIKKIDARLARKKEKDAAKESSPITPKKKEEAKTPPQ